MHHFRGRRYVSVHLEASEKHLDALEDVHKSVLAFPDILGRLKIVRIRLRYTELLGIRTERRTPIPAKTTLAGENTCQINIRVQIPNKSIP